MTTVSYPQSSAVRSWAEPAAPAPVEVIKSGPSMAARMVHNITHATVYPTLSLGYRALEFPWPFGLIEGTAKLIRPPLGLKRHAVELPNAHAELIRAQGVARETGRVVLYCHGGGFLLCGINTHLRIIERISRHADAPVLAPNYRMLPKHTIHDAVDDCRDTYYWLRANGYRDDQIVISGDSAGGYLAMTLAQRLLEEGEMPAALALLSPLLQLDSQRPKKRGPMLPHNIFRALTELITNHDGALYEPLDNIAPGMPPTLIHVSGSEELLYDARQAVTRLTDAGVAAQLHVWPGQIHVFQLAAPLVAEASRSLHEIGSYIRGAVG